MIKLFGPDRVRIGDPDTNWAVWISGMDDIHTQPNVEAALSFAADHNASACADYDGNPYSPVTYAVVLHQGYAWSSHVEHRAGRDCGVSGCVHCGTDRNIAASREPVTIPAQVANHILWHENHGGYEPGSFTKKLLAAWAYADDANTARLAAGWPEYAAAIRLMQQPGGKGVDELKAIAERPF